MKRKIVAITICLWMGIGAFFLTGEMAAFVSTLAISGLVAFLLTATESGKEILERMKNAP